MPGWCIFNILNGEDIDDVISDRCTVVCVSYQTYNVNLNYGELEVLLNLKKSLKGHCHGLTCAEFKSAKTHFTATKTYKYWSSFDKNDNASVMKLKKSSIIVIPPKAQDPNLKTSA